MPKKIRNDSIFIKPDSAKIKKLKSNNKSKKVFQKKDLNSLSKFSLASTIIILSFFALPIVTDFLHENFQSNIEVSNISKKNFDLTFNNKIIIKDLFWRNLTLDKGSVTDA